MMIFYEKDTGKIVGTVNGRIHSPEEMRMWVGDKAKTERIVCQWVEKSVDGKKALVPENDPEMFEKLETERMVGRRYKVDTKTKKVIEKTQSEITQDEVRRAEVRKGRKTRKSNPAELEEKIKALENRISKMEKDVK